MRALRWRYRCALLTLAALATAAHAEAPPLKALRTQRVGDTTYFHVRFERPAGMHVPKVAGGPFSEGDKRKLAQFPQLVPQDARAAAVYPRFEPVHLRPNVQLRDLPASVPIEGLEFVGKVTTERTARFVLLYPTRDKGKATRAARHDHELAALLAPVRWAQVPVKLDFAAAEAVNGLSHRPSDDLRRLWAEAQAAQLAVLEVLAPEFGFYGFACAATGRKYGVSDPVLEAERRKGEEHVHRRALDLTTGTAAITQSLALNRLKRADFRDHGPRTIDVKTVPAIDIAEHPWEKMMAGQRPAPEPLAQMIPHDNYYIRFGSARKFAEFSDFLDQWGTTASRAYELNSRDYQLKERYEQQLCLRSTWLGRQFGPWLVRGIAVTGSDPYIREGSDVTVIFHVNNRQAFLAGVEQFLEEARSKFKDQLKESHDSYWDIPIQRYVTPLREVSVHRAAFDQFVVYSNSPVALRRVLQTYNGDRKSLWGSLDFQYMRTVFRADDKEEDGFAFLSDAFIRQLVGPASKIKEMRRLEALTSLSMLTHGALFTAWETGKLPADHDALMEAVHLRPQHLYLPEGKTIRWDAERQVAVSDAYNTLHFATPLIELPLGKITALEDQTYRQFRAEYLRLWQQFFDPVGMRFSLNEERVKLEVYILPLINNAEYNNLRWLTGGGTLAFDPATLSPRSLAQLTLRLNLRFFGIRDWGMIRVEDDARLGYLANEWIRQDLDPRKAVRWFEEPVLARLPITFGVGIGDQREFDENVSWLKESFLNHQGPAKVDRFTHKKVTVTRVVFGPDSQFVQRANQSAAEGQKLSEVVLYHAQIDKGWYAGFSKSAILDLIDRAEQMRQGPIPNAKQTVPVSVSWHLSPEAAARARDALRFYLEWETHKRALPNNAAWYALYRGGLVDGTTPAAEKRATALNFLGFIPVSPDDTAYVYNARSDEVVNERHGSLRRPRLHSGIAERSPIKGLLAQFPNLRVDMRFREDGMHAVVTIARKRE